LTSVTPLAWPEPRPPRAAVEAYRVYYGDGGEEIDSRFVKGLVNRQVRE
jgi:hypothetical protein